MNRKRQAIKIFGFFVIIQQDPAYDAVASKVLLHMQQAPRGHKEVIKAPAILKKNKSTEERLQEGGKASICSRKRIDRAQKRSHRPAAKATKPKLEISKLSAPERRRMHEEASDRNTAHVQRRADVTALRF